MPEKSINSQMGAMTALSRGPGKEEKFLQVPRITSVTSNAQKLARPTLPNMVLTYSRLAGKAAVRERQEKRVERTNTSAACLNHTPQQVPELVDNYRKYLENGSHLQMRKCSVFPLRPHQTENRISPATVAFAH